MNTLKFYIEQSKYTLTDIAHELGISYMTMYRKYNGISPYKRSEILVICSMLKIDEETREDILDELRR